MTILLVFMIHQVNGYKNNRPTQGRAVVSPGKPIFARRLARTFHFMLNLGIPPQGKQSPSAYLFSCCCIHIASIFMHCIEALQRTRFVASWFHVEMQNCFWSDNSGSSKHLRECVSFVTLSSFFLQSNIDKTLECFRTWTCFLRGELEHVLKYHNEYCTCSGGSKWNPLILDLLELFFYFKTS